MAALGLEAGAKRLRPKFLMRLRQTPLEVNMSRLLWMGAAAIVLSVQPIACAILVTALPFAARAQSLPSGVAACASEKDDLKRLSCYDREVGRIVAPSPAASGESALIAARVVRIENYEDEIIVHLDNGQVWQQVEEAQADANLRPGDAVTIVRSSGSYWLSGRNGAALKVRRKK